MGIYLYAYLLIRSKSAWLNWGRPDTFSQLIQVILREQYADLERARSLPVVASQVKRIMSNVYFEYSGAGLIAAAAGLALAFKAQKKTRLVFFAVLAAVIFATLAFYLNLKDDLLWIMDVFMIPVYMAMAVFGSQAIKACLELIPDSGFRIPD